MVLRIVNGVFVFGPRYLVIADEAEIDYLLFVYMCFENILLFLM